MDLLLGIRLNPLDKMSIIKLNGIDIKDSVANLKAKTLQQINSPSDSFDFIYCGCLLDNQTNLEFYGLKSGSMIHVLKKKDNNVGTKSVASEINVDVLASIFKSFIANPILEIVMRRLTKRPDIIENIISSTPGLSEDAVAIAILQDPDLIVHFTNSKSIKKIAELHPALLEAAHHIATAVHDEARKFSVSSTSANSTSSSNAQNSGHSYSLENMSDDEEMAGDSSQSSDSTQPSSSATSSRTNSTVNAQLLTAIARAGRSAANESNNAMGLAQVPVQPSLPQANSSGGDGGGGGGVITFEMFYQAMQQAFASSTAANSSETPAQASSPMSSAPSTFSNTLENSSSAATNLQRQIAIMHEMGLQNDAVNIQALQITNGDVQAAIELVLNGFGDN